MDSVIIKHGDCIDVMRTLEAESVHSIITDPPYGLSFLGKDWDTFKARKETQSQSVKGLGAGMRMTTADENLQYQHWVREWATEALRVLKPGGWIAAFGAPRLMHRQISGIEEAGFQIREQLLWLYGTGYPKSQNLGGGWGTGLKPAYEPIVLGRKPFEGTLRDNHKAHGLGGFNVDACRVVATDKVEMAKRSHSATIYGYHTERERHQTEGQKIGRFPANVLHDNSDDVREVLPNGTARFFYTAKATPADREAGLESLPTINGRKNQHPTVKPTELMRWLCKLITPEGGTVLDPFMGSGSTGRASILDRFSFIGIEREAEYIKIAELRMENAKQNIQENLF